MTLLTMVTKYSAFSDASREIIYMKRLLFYTVFDKYAESPIVSCDNQNVIELSKNAVFHERSKHIDITYHFTRKLVDQRSPLRL